MLNKHGLSNYDLTSTNNVVFKILVNKILICRDKSVFIKKFQSSYIAVS